MNPFIERSRITDPAHFTGRWREVSLVFERIERRRPVMVTGASGVGKSSLITHVAQSATTVMEIPGMRSLFLDLAVLPDAPTCIELIVRALGGQGQTIAALELALAERGNTVLISMDNVDSAIAAGWGADLLERLARLARRSVPVYPGGLAPPGAGEFDMLLVTATGREPPMLSEPFATVTLGAIATSEVRLLCEAYLDDTGVEFSPTEMHALERLSAGHPAYLQRAAYHLFIAHTQPSYAWQAAYRAEAREQPISGAPLPAAIFSDAEDAEDDEREELIYGDDENRQAAGGAERPRRPQREIEGPGSLIAAIAPLIGALLALQISGSWMIACIVIAIGYGLVVVIMARKTT